MNMIIKYDRTTHNDLSHLIDHRAGSLADTRRLRAEIDAGAEGTRFSITDPDGAVLIEGTFHGDDIDRNWPLMSARLFATDEVNPQFITYADGVSFTYSKELDAVINIKEQR